MIEPVSADLPFTAGAAIESSETDSRVIVHTPRASWWQALRRHGVLATFRTRLRNSALELRRLMLTRIWGMHIHKETMISLSVKLDKTYPRGIHIGKGTNISFGTAVLSHDLLRDLYLETRIGDYCGIGAHCLILPGVKIGDHCVIGAGSVVTKDIPPNSLAVGNPARVIRTDLQTTRWGKILDRGMKV